MNFHIQLVKSRREIKQINTQITHLLNATKDMTKAENKILSSITVLDHLLKLEENLIIKKADVFLLKQSNDSFTGYTLWQYNKFNFDPTPYEIDNNKKSLIKSTNEITNKDDVLLIPVKSEKKKFAFFEIEYLSDDSNNYKSNLKFIEGITNSLSLTLENIEAEEKNKLAGIGSMAATIVHDLKNPIGAIMGYAQMASDDDISMEMRKEFLEIIYKEAGRLSNMAHEVLEYSRGELNLIIEEVDSKIYIDDIAKTLSPIFMNDDIVFEYEDNYKGVLKFDSDRIRRVILNLATNARDAMAGSNTFNASFSLEMIKQKDGVMILAKDNGPGIPYHIQATIFEPFVTYGKSHGTGLGMAIVKKIIEAHGGNIIFETESGKGTLFSMFLPISELNLNKVLKSQTLKLDKNKRTINILADKKILIVDDNPIHSQIYKEYLKSIVASCELAANADKAMIQLYMALDNSPFDIAVINKKLPGEDGYVLGQKIKNDLRLKNIILIMIAEPGTRGDVDIVKKIGFDAYLTKQITANQLIECLTTLLKNENKTKVVITQNMLSDSLKSKINILMAEDNPVNQKLILRMLNKSGYNATVVANGKEAVKAVETRKYDLILMDIQMPEMDGFTATRIIRSQLDNNLNEDVPIIAMTGHSMNKDIENCFESGMNDYISKPINHDNLIIKIEKFIYKERL